jgi:hypothetical protein
MSPTGHKQTSAQAPHRGPPAPASPRCSQRPWTWGLRAPLSSGLRLHQNGTSPFDISRVGLSPLILAEHVLLVFINSFISLRLRIFRIKQRTVLSPVELCIPRELGEAHGESRTQPRPLLSRWELLIVTDVTNIAPLALASEIATPSIYCSRLIAAHAEARPDRTTNLTRRLGNVWPLGQF